jgi:hypothetical protein
MSYRIKPLLITVALACAGFGATAQMPGDGPQGMHHPEGGMHGMRMSPERMQARHEKHMAELKGKLKITSAQESAWSTFTASMKPPARPEGKHPDRAEIEKLSTPERLDAMRTLRNQHMTEMNAAMDKRHDDIKAFYGTLSTEQKKTFDSETAHIAGRHGRGDGPGRGREDHKATPAAPATPTAPKK